MTDLLIRLGFQTLITLVSVGKVDLRQGEVRIKQDQHQGYLFPVRFTLI